MVFIMDNGSPVGLSISEGVNSSDTLKKLYTEPSQYNCHVLEDVSPDELGNGLSKLALESVLWQPSDKTNNCNLRKEHECEDPDQTESTIITSNKCLYKCSTFPCPGEKTSLTVSADGEDNATAVVLKHNDYESVKPAYTQSVSLPNPLRLISAMKGSREKQGIHPKKLTVTWAPDVYDPPPSASAHLKIYKPRHKSESQRKYDKKNGKNKQKGKHSKLGSSKGKNQVQKSGGSSSRFYPLLNSNDQALTCAEPCGDLTGFGVGSSDSYCGSGFLTKSVTKLHFSVAEAR